MTIRIKGELEIDQRRGVIYFHSTDSRLKGLTVLRICRLPRPIPNPLEQTEDMLLDITHMIGTSWKQVKGE